MRGLTDAPSRYVLEFDLRLNSLYEIDPESTGLVRAYDPEGNIIVEKICYEIWKNI